MLSVLNTFVLSISGYKLNVNAKSERFPLNVAARKYPLHTIPFRIVLDNLTYLGSKSLTNLKIFSNFSFLILPLRMELSPSDLIFA